MLRNDTAKSAVAVALLMSLCELGRAQDVDYVRAIERAQQQRPATIGNSARIAPPDEPGTPMVLHGRVVDGNGAPAAGTIVFAYHTDRAGLYDAAEAGAHSWRLKGWVKADAEGRFTFETIRPGPYPNRDVPAHVHFTLFTLAGERFDAGEVRFADDALVSRRELAESKKAGAFGVVRPVRRERNVQTVEFALRIDPARRL